MYALPTTANNAKHFPASGTLTIADLESFQLDFINRFKFRFQFLLFHRYNRGLPASPHEAEPGIIQKFTNFQS